MSVEDSLRDGFVIVVVWIDLEGNSYLLLMEDKKNCLSKMHDTVGVNLLEAMFLAHFTSRGFCCAQEAPNGRMGPKKKRYNTPKS
jgi:hypothetical protein